MPSPISLKVEPDGSLQPAPYTRGWSRRLVDSRPIEARAEGGAWTETALDRSAENFSLDGQLELCGGPGGFLLGADDCGGAVRVELSERLARVVDIRSARAEDDAPWLAAKVLGEVGLPAATRRAIRLLRVGAELELSIDGRVELSVDVGRSETQQRGLSLYIEGGRASFSSAELARVR